MSAYFTYDDSSYQGYDHSYDSSASFQHGMLNGVSAEYSQIGSSSLPMEEGVWTHQLSCVMDDANNSVTSMEYDTCYERLWVGHRDGRVKSLRFERSSTGLHEAFIYSSFSSTRNNQVVGLHPVSDYIISTTTSNIRINTNGGISVASVESPQVIESGGISVSANFSCSGLCHPGGYDMIATHLLAGTKRNITVAYDLSSLTVPVLTMDIGASAVCCRENRFYSGIACEDGKVKLVDCRLRSSKLLHTLDAHSGPCLDMWMSPNDTTLFTCGKFARVNTTDGNAMKYSYDPLVKVFDLRTNRQLPPLRMTGTTPNFIRFIPSPSSQGGYGAQIMLVSGNGQLQLFDPNGNGSDAQILYSQMASQRDSVNSVAVASSGQLLATANYSGVITQFSVGLATDSVASDNHKINSNSLELSMPPLDPRPPMSSFGINSQLLASAYVLSPSSTEMEPLASSFSGTNVLRTARYKLTSKRVISKELLNKVHYNDFIGNVNNPGFSPNSMLYSSSINGMRAYAISDPRNVDTTELGLTPAKVNPKKESAPLVERPNILPIQYRKQHSYRGKARMNKFNYSVHNSTECMALENVSPNSYTNTILQILFSMPEIRAIALASQASTYHHQNPHTLWCELGFLFHMILSVQKEYDSSKYEDLERIVTPANFQRTFQCIPEAVALGLFDGSHADSQALVQTFIRFILQQMHKESELESRSQHETGGRRNTTRSFSAVDDIFGFSVVSNTRFLVSNKVEVGVPIRSFALEVVYPSTKGQRRGAGAQPTELDLTKLNGAHLKPGDQPSSFAHAIWGSLRKETSMRGWCKSSESYEPFKQVRSLLSLPRVLTLLCGETQKDASSSTISGALGEVQSQGSMHACYWSSKSVVGGAWLPIKLEVAMLRVGIESASQTRLIVSGLLVPGPDAPKSCAEVWVIYDGVNDSIASVPASMIPSYGIVLKAAIVPVAVNLNKPYNPNPLPPAVEVKSDEWEVVTLNLAAVISQVQSELEPSSPDGIVEHAVLHIKRDFSQFRNSKESAVSEWILCNDFSIQSSEALDVVSFPAWRHPCAIFFSRSDYHFGVAPIDTSNTLGCTSIPVTVMNLPSQSSVPSIRLGPATLPGKGELIAFDAEFVTVQLEQAEVNAEGQRVIVSEARQNVARVSFVRGGKKDLDEGAAPPAIEVLADDYVIPSETILDYLTRFSGIVAEDLQPGVSRNAVVHNRTAYLKLRLFVDRGCVFVGHGLNTDFDTANIYVPKEQIVDTVELWRLPGQRKLSLRFLAAYFLKEDIQDEVHDSIEDAKIALLLYRHYQSVANKGHLHLQGVLQELYAYGVKTNWTIAA